MTSLGLHAMLPEALLAVLILGLVGLEAMFTPRRRSGNTGWVALLGVLLVLAVALARWDTGASGEPGLVGAIPTDDWATFFDILFLTQAALVTLLSMAPGSSQGSAGGERHVLVLAATLGMMVAVGAADLMLLVLGLGLAAMSGQILAGLWDSTASREAGTRYSQHSALTAGLSLMGVGLVYGATGSSDLGELSQVLLAGATPTGSAPAGLVLLVIGMSFWALAVPGHWWAVHTIPGVPVQIGVLLVVVATAPVAAGARLLVLGFFALQGQWAPLIWAIAALTMALGGLLALNERDLRRLLGAIAITQIGTAFMGVATATREGLAATALHLTVYSIAVLGLGAAMRMCRVQTGQSSSIDDWAGLGRRHPVLGLAVALSLLTLAWLPPTGGFAARLLLYHAGAQSGLVGLVMVALFSQILIFARPDATTTPTVAVSSPAAAVAALTAGVLLGLGLYPEPLAALCRLAARSLL